MLDEAPTGDVPETPLTPTVATVTRYLLGSVDDAFTAPEVVLSDTSGDVALQIPEDTIPDGEERYIAYGRPASQGDYDHVYLYPEGHRNTFSQIGAWVAGAESRYFLECRCGCSERGFLMHPTRMNG